MKTFIDANVMFSAALNWHSTPAKAIKEAMRPPRVAMICENSFFEFQGRFNEKFPDRRTQLLRFLQVLLPMVRVVPVPAEPSPLEAGIRDPKDRPILRAALAAGADILLTGDRDFLECGVKQITFMSPRDFLEQV